MSTSSTSLFLSLDTGVPLAREASGLDVQDADLHQLINIGLLPNFGTLEQPVILAEHLRLFSGKVGTLLELADSLMQPLRIPLAVDIARHLLLHLSPSLALSFDPDRISSTVLRAFIRAVRLQSDTSGTCGEWNQNVCVISNALCLWLPHTPNTEWYVRQWEDCESAQSRTSSAESLCVPPIYGNKGRLTSFLLGAIRQNLSDGSPICDLMAGTGLVSRHLMRYFTVYANDAARFAETLTASQSVAISESQVKDILAMLGSRFEENYSAVLEALGPALNVEDHFLFGGLTPANLSNYRTFTLACTRFVPENVSRLSCEHWNDADDAFVRSRFTAIVDARRSRPHVMPYVLSTAYWGNCYFGLRQAAEIDSLRYGISYVESVSERTLLEALLLAAVAACSSTPHYAQPPLLTSDGRIRKVIGLRSRSVYDEFKLRLLLACRRRSAEQGCRAIWNLHWRDALLHFSDATTGNREKAVYVDPPYSRLQYSRFYHVFDTLLRYDYPACLDNGRTSEREKRFSSRFDSRQSSAIDEFRLLFENVRKTDSALFLSYSNSGTVPVDVLMGLMQSMFRSVSVYALPTRHHSQGQSLKDRGYCLELILVGKP